jgi:two-component system, chemotaxis family, CheB/CheR fusion protein
MTSTRPGAAEVTPLPDSAQQGRSQDKARGTDAFLLVCIGASAGGLDACGRLLDVLPPESGMAFILVQHLDPTHASMMVELLSEHTKMRVLPAAHDLRIEPNHLYVIPPATDLSVLGGCLQLSNPRARHGTRLPFDNLLRSVAHDRGARVACVVLSGGGADGSLGLRAVSDTGGLVIAQDPEEARYAGMPNSAIETGSVDLVLPLADIPEALDRFGRQMVMPPKLAAASVDERAAGWLPRVIELLRSRTPHDFGLYRSGTLHRRIRRRMAMAAINPEDVGAYTEMLQRDSGELDRLAKDLLINVTQFFRDAEVFEFLGQSVLPDLIRASASDQPLRVWVAGCSTGEETYSLLMLFHEEIAKQSAQVKLQFFASDVDSDAVARAREGLYPNTIMADVSADRLTRFFTKEDHGYRILPELRSSVVFAVQDVLSDPPFSRIDMVSCRNLLIYLGPEAQAKVLSLFRFALRPGGILLLGTAETAGAIEGRFEIVSKAARVYRRIGHSRPGEFGFIPGLGDGGRGRAPPGAGRVSAPKVDPGELVRRALLETYAPASILINLRHECLFLSGPTDRYLRLAPGRPSHDLLDMIRPEMRSKLRSAVKRAVLERTAVVVVGGRTERDGHPLLFRIDIQPVTGGAGELLLVSFVDAPESMDAAPSTDSGPLTPRVTELERELDATRAELRGVIQDLDLSSEEQKAINEEALSVNEEYQSTNEELRTSKEELQSLNEELTALNSQLQETLDRQRTTSDDLQNVLYSTDVATLFLDVDLKIRLFTPATRSLFAIIPTDVGRPLADFRALAPDGDLLDDARSVLQTHDLVEREIQAGSGIWFRRRIMPYRTHNNHVEGVVITFTDVTKRKSIAKALEEAKQQAEQATMAKSRFLAAASHDLRQPLQTLALLHGLLAKTVEGERERGLLARFEQTLDAMSGMLNALLDINQIESGVVRPEITTVPVNDILDRMRDEFTYHAQAKGLALRVMPCALKIASDPRLLEQMIRNLLSNAIKYTTHGKVLLGCRRCGETLGIEIWDTGIGIPAAELQSIFGEYHQIDNKARERSLGLGLGLSIVQRLAKLLDHRVRVSSHHRQGSVFRVEVSIVSARSPSPSPRDLTQPNRTTAPQTRMRSATILVVEDDPEVRDLLELFLRDERHRPITAPDGPIALQMMRSGSVDPDLILADYNLPKDMNGLQLALETREILNHGIPIVILTGDISSATLREVAEQNCVLLHKPVKLDELSTIVDRLLRAGKAALTPPCPPLAKAAGELGDTTVYIVDDDDSILESISAVVAEEGGNPISFSSGEAFLKSYQRGRHDCLLIDAYLPGMNGVVLLRALRAAGHLLPAIMITGNSDVTMAVQAMKAGASDFLEKPVKPGDILASIRQAVERSHSDEEILAWKATATTHLAALTPRQHQIMHLVLEGLPSKNIAADLAISQRTVESHRASIMKKTGSASLPALARLVMAASWTGHGVAI